MELRMEFDGVYKFLEALESLISDERISKFVEKRLAEEFKLTQKTSKEERDTWAIHSD